MNIQRNIALIFCLTVFIVGLVMQRFLLNHFVRHLQRHPQLLFLPNGKPKSTKPLIQIKISQ